MQIRKILLSTVAAASFMAAGAAMAADLPRAQSPIYAPAPAATWTGFYVGVHGGGGWATSDSTFITPPGPSTADFDLSGPYIGAQAGYNWQLANNWLLGVEGDVSWSGVNGVRVTGGPGGTTTLDVDWFGTLRARLGYAMGTWMPYVTGGVAWAGGTRTNDGSGAQSATATHTGWTIGAGAEWAFAQNWTMKAEYKYLDLGSAAYNFPIFPASVAVKMHTLELGLNYKF